MRILVLDTSTERGVAALIHGETPIFSLELPFGLQSSQFLLPELQKKMQMHGINLKDIDLIAVGTGPGSYTGIRVGATVAKTLSFAQGIPLTGVGTLDLFLPQQEGIFAVLIDAKIGGVYLRKAQLNKGHIEFLSEALVLPLADATSFLIGTPVLITPNARSLQNKFGGLYPTHVWDWQESYPSINRLAQLGKERFLKGEHSRDGRLELLYMRKTQAEIEKDVHDRSQR